MTAQDDHVLVCKRPLWKFRHRLIGASSHYHGVDVGKEGFPYQCRMRGRGGDVGAFGGVGEPVDAAIWASDVAVAAHAGKDLSRPGAWTRSCLRRVAHSRPADGDSNRE